MEKIKGKIERVNPKGLKVEGKWYNYSKYMEGGQPEVKEGDEVQLNLKGDWILGIVGTPSENESVGNERRNTERQVIITRLACLNTATEILKSHTKPITSASLFKVAKELERWVWEGREGQGGTVRGPGDDGSP